MPRALAQCHEDPFVGFTNSHSDTTRTATATLHPSSHQHNHQHRRAPGNNTGGSSIASLPCSSAPVAVAPLESIDPLRRFGAEAEGIGGNGKGGDCVGSATDQSVLVLPSIGVAPRQRVPSRRRQQQQQEQEQGKQQQQQTGEGEEGEGEESEKQQEEQQQQQEQQSQHQHPRQRQQDQQQRQQKLQQTGITAFRATGDTPENISEGQHSGAGNVSELPETGHKAHGKINVMSRDLPVWPENAPLPPSVATGGSTACWRDGGKDGGGTTPCLDAETLKALSRLFLSKLQVSVEVRCGLDPPVESVDTAAEPESISFSAHENSM